MAAPRIQIQAVSPQVDCGRYAAKACLGDEVTVGATIFRDGHDVLAAAVRYRHTGTRSWHEVALAPIGNDRWAGTFAPGALGRWELRVQAWVDPYATWLDE